jgi:protoheme IX farnesyltransferase
MATEPLLAPFDVFVVESRGTASRALWSDYWAMTKPEVNFLIAVTAAVGFYLGSPGISRFAWTSLLNTVLGTALVASGAGALNQWMEHRFDARMRRTARRPIAAGRVEPIRALVFGVALSLTGAAYLFLTTNNLASLLAVATLVSYLFLYTPSKRITPLCTLIGAFPGAIPPLIGWAAARGSLDPQAWVLFAVVFFWQFPHFMAIAWMYREDYARAGYLVLPAGTQKNHFVIWQTVLPALVLLPLSLIPANTGVSGLAYSACAFLLGAGFLYYGVRFGFRRSNVAARRLLVASIIYLPAVFALMTLNKK